MEEDSKKILTYLNLALSSAKQAWLEIDLKTKKVTVSNKYAQLFGYDSSEIPSSIKELRESIHPDDKKDAIDTLDHSFEEGRSAQVVYRKKHKNGTWLWIKANSKVIAWDNDGKASRLIGIHMDITDQKRDEEVLHALAKTKSLSSNDIFKVIVQQLAISYEAKHAFVSKIRNDDQNIVDTLAGWSNDGFIDNFSYSLQGTPCLNVKLNHENVCLFPRNVQILFPNDHELATMGVESYLGLTLKDSKGEVIGLLSILDDKPMDKQIKGKEDLLNTLAIRAATELERTILDEKMTQLAHYDPLTQLPNRSLFSDRFKQATFQSKRNKSFMALCFLDLDNFKPVNDSYGHDVGDKLLIQVANRIKNDLREEDTLSRQGGDEFVLLLGNITSYKECEPIIERIMSSFLKPFLIDSHDIKISASMGVALSTKDDIDLDTLLRYADQAMYKAKNLGKNQHHLFDRLSS